MVTSGIAQSQNDVMRINCIGMTRDLYYPNGYRTDNHPRARAQINTPNRFESFHVEPDPDADPSEQHLAQTIFIKDATKTIIAHNDSPDVGFSASINPYRGCEHGCSYCFARNGHTYLGMSAGLDFETKIMVKLDAADLLRKEFSKKSYVPERIAISGVTDCYQPVERRLRITRGILEVMVECRHPASLITKNHLITRDIDLLSEMARWGGTGVMISITSLDAELSAKMEPRVSAPRQRLAAVEALAKAGIPVGVMVAPIIPGLTDHESLMILKAASEAGARTAGFVPLRLAADVRLVFENWLTHHYPIRANKILNKLKSMHGGKVYNSTFGERMRGEGPIAEQIADMVHLAKSRFGLDESFPPLSLEHFRRPQGAQLSLF